MKPPPVRFFDARVMAIGLTMTGLLALGGAWLRETPLFWQNAGGYPVGLRTLVLYGFHLTYAIYFFGLLLASVRGWRMLKSGSRSGYFLLLVCGLNGLMFLGITTFVVWNNIENVLEGRPLHYHPQ